jgi:hypothetical protein
MWAQVKSYLAEEKNIFKFSDIERLTQKATDSIQT